MKDLATQEQFVELRAQGMSFATIAERLGVAKSTLIAWSKDSKYEIGNLRQIHIEAIHEKYRMGAERKVEMFAKQLDTVEGELAKRDMATIPTERLFDLLIKLTRELNLTTAPLSFTERPTEFLLEDMAPLATWEA
jgi:transcriptional regulator with XRE-family HTH domain